jgi:acyl-coenzyme A thioesterase PaaI-like protein
MWQANVSSRAVATLHLLRLVCAVAMTSTHNTQNNLHGSFGFQPLNRILLSSPREQLRVRCDDGPTTFYPSQTSRISPLHGTTPTSSTSKTTAAIEESSPQGHCLLVGEKYEPMTLPTRGQLEGHAIFGTLFGKTMIERYQIWKRRTDLVDDLPSSDNAKEDVVIGLVTFGSHLNGHSSLVHGGILSLVFDDICGFAYEAVGVEHAVTANLTVNFRAPVPAGSQVRLAVQLEAREGRKLYWKAQMTSLDKETLYAEASSLYIIPRSAVQ